MTAHRPAQELLAERPLGERSESGQGPLAVGDVAAPALGREPRTEGPTPKARVDGLHIPSLDGIRALSFFIVFLSHAGLAGIVPGYLGLSIFFFLSGFLITTLLRIEFDRTGTISFQQFYLRRVL